MIIESQLLVECQAQEINPDKHNNDPDDFIEYITANPCRILDFFTKRSSHRADGDGWDGEPDSNKSA